MDSTLLPGENNRAGQAAGGAAPSRTLPDITRTSRSLPKGLRCQSCWQTLQTCLPPPAVASPLLKPIAISVVGMVRPVLARVIAMTTRPGLLRLSLIGAVVAITPQPTLVPASPPLTLTGRLAAIALLGNLRTRLECLAA
jgi:hypothetical protein